MTYPIAYYRARAEALGYFLLTKFPDQLGRNIIWPYCTAPKAGGGYGFFETKEQLDRYLSEVERNRKWQEEDGPLVIEIDQTEKE